MDITNGEGVGISLFVQGCPFHCKNCFNGETWDFNGGKPWMTNSKTEFLKLLNRDYVHRVSILGGEPLAEQNSDEVLELLQDIRKTFPDKIVWLYSGYTWESIWSKPMYSLHNVTRQQILQLCNVFVDGQYVDELRDLKLHWRGSSNQRLINVRKSLVNGELILWE